MATILERIKANVKIDEATGCWIWQLSKMRSGYGQIQTGKTMAGVHRIAYREVVGEIPDSLHVLHSCDVKLCCNPAHLFIGTQKENILDAVEKGRMQRGEGHYKTHLTDENVRSILRKLAAGEKQKVLAAEYGVVPGTINNIAHRRTWKHIKIGVS